MLKLATIPFCKQANKFISCLLAVVILLSTSISSMMFVSANGDNVSIVRKMYNTYTVNNDWTSQTHLKNVGDLNSSLINGKSPYYWNGSSYADGSTDTNFPKLTDGSYAQGSYWFNKSFYNVYSYTHEGTNYSGSSQRMYYDLGVICKVDSIVLIDANNASSSDLTLPSFKVYASENYSEHLLFDLNSPVASYTIASGEHVTEGGSHMTVYTITFNEAIDARYVGFEFPQYGCYKNDPANGGNGGKAVVLYELAVFGDDGYHPDMNNTYYKLTKDKKLNITYMGGSVTSGYGATEPNVNSWRALTTKWLEETYPNATINSVNGAVGSTGSHFAVYNYGRITSHKTDLLFIDSAINDYYLYFNKIGDLANPEASDSYNTTLRNLESLICNAKAENKNIDIVLVLTFDHWRLSDASNPSIKAMLDLAKKYNLYYIDLREPLKAKAAADGLAWTETALKHYRRSCDCSTCEYDQLYKKGDGVHPIDAGYKLFADYIKEQLSDYFEQADAANISELKDNSVVPEKLSASLIDKPNVITVDKIPLAEGWTLDTSKNFSSIGSKTYGTTYNSGIVTTSTPNSTLTYTFTGTDFGIITMTGQNYGKLYVEIDGVPYRQGKNGDFEDGVIDLYRSRDKDDHLTQVIAQGLDYGQHTVTLKAVEGKNDNKIIIGSYYVSADEVSDVSIDREMYNNYTVNNDWTSQSHLKNVGDLSSSLINDKSPYYWDGSSYADGSTDTNFPKLTDGSYAQGSNWFNKSFYNVYSYTHEGTNYSGSSQRMYYDLGVICKVDSIVLIDANNASSSDLTLPSFKVYASENYSEHLLFDLNSPVASYTIKSDEHVTKSGKYMTVYTITFKEAIDARYVGFEFPQYGCYKNDPANGGNGGNAVVLFELAVFGTLTVSDEESDYKITSLNCSNSGKTIDNSNLIFGVNPEEKGNISQYTDGKQGGDNPYEFATISFPFVGNTTISKVIVTSREGYGGNLKSRLAEYEIYIADSYESLYKDENKVAYLCYDEALCKTNWSLGVDIFEFSSSYEKTGKYIGFKILKGSYGGIEGKNYITEIEVFGTSEGGSGGAAVLGTRPTLQNVDKNLTHTTGKATVSGGRGFYDNITLYKEAHTNQYVALDYAYNEVVTPVVWARAICSTESNASLTGYYVYMDRWTTKLYKRTSDGVDTYIGLCGQHSDYKDKDIRLEIVTEKVGSSTKITVSTYKVGNDNQFKLMLKNVYFDDTAELQTPGYAGYAVQGVNKTAEIKGFEYSSSDGTADNFAYIENPITEKGNGIAGQKVIIDPAKTYVLSARASHTNTSLAVYYFTAESKMESAFASVGTISNVNGYRTITYEFCLNDMISENGLSAPYADKYGYDNMAEVFVGFAVDKSKVLSYSNLKLTAKGSNDNILVNGDLKMGILGFCDNIDNQKWGLAVSGYGDTTSYNGRLVLKSNVSQSDYDAIFKMGDNESTGIDYSKYDKLMIHLTSEGSDYGTFGQMFSLDIGETYVYEVDFAFNPRNNATPLIFYHTVKDVDITYSNETRIKVSYKLSMDGCRYIYEFTIPKEAYANPETGKATIFVGLSTGKQGRDCYLYNFDLYKKSDASKTNLFLNPDFKDGFKNWIVNNNYIWKYISTVSIKTYVQPGKGIEFLPYDASKFTSNDGSYAVPNIPDFDYSNYKGKYMICIPETVNQTYGKLGQILEFEKGATYNFTMLFKYIRQNSTKPLVSYFLDDPYADNDYIISKGYVNSNGEVNRQAYWAAIRKAASTDVVMDDENCKITVTFKVPSDAWKNSSGKAPMFVGISTGEYETLCYFADLCVAKEGSNNNMFKNADFKEGFNHWIAKYGWVLDPAISGEGIFWTGEDIIAQILPFDETIFVNDTNDALWKDGDWFSIFGIDDTVDSFNTNSGSSSNDTTKTVIVRGKINIPATIALYGGIVVVLAGVVITIIVLNKKKKKEVA